MKLIRPTIIDDASLVSSSVPENDAAAWAAGTTYAKDAQVIRGHRIWNSSTDNNKGHDPLNPSPTDTTIWWTDNGPTNRWAMLDKVVGTQTTGTGQIQVVLDPGGVDSLAVIDTDAETITVAMPDAGYSQTQTTNVGGGSIDDWYDYFFEEIGTKSVVAFMDVPNLPGSQITVTLAGSDPNGPVAVGTLIVGRQMDVGTTLGGPKPGITDYSRKETDQFGNVSVVEGAFSKRASLQVYLPTEYLDFVYKEIAKLRATPVLWIGEEGFDVLVIYGFWKSFEPDMQTSKHTYCSLEIEGLI